MGSIRPSAPSAFDIAKYWVEVEPRFVVDISEPSCFACHFWMEGWTCWRFARGLERCHIVADSIGGSAFPSNFLLLCNSCHREAPMADDPRIMLNWARSHESWISRLYRDTASVFRDFGDTFKLGNAKQIERFQAFLRERKFDAHPRSTPREQTLALLQMLRTFLDTTSEECLGL